MRFFFGVSQWNVDIPKLAAIGVRFIMTDRAFFNREATIRS